ncbi:MAG TPA: hypothetical protein DD437_02545, partial [Rhodobiaceae bacterium]|nr:hypothetical protein [Rhodobiaceae bacterium]
MKNLLVAALAATFAMTSVPAMADVFMPGHEVAAVVVGNTIEGQYRECGAARNDFREHYTADGKIKGEERPCNQAGDWATYGGAWTVEDG